MKKINLIFIFAFNLFLVGCVSTEKGFEPTVATSSTTTPTNYYQLTLTKIIDGDTIRGDVNTGLEIVLENQTIRLLGVNTPETRTRDLEEKARGLKSKKEVKRLLNNADQVWISVPWPAERDSFGRILAEVWADHIHVNSYLIENDLAEIFYP